MGNFMWNQLCWQLWGQTGVFLHGFCIIFEPHFQMGGGRGYFVEFVWFYAHLTFMGAIWVFFVPFLHHFGTQIPNGGEWGYFYAIFTHVDNYGDIFMVFVCFLRQFDNCGANGGFFMRLIGYQFAAHHSGPYFHQLSSSQLYLSLLSHLYPYITLYKCGLLLTSPITITTTPNHNHHHNHPNPWPTLATPNHPNPWPTLATPNHNSPNIFINSPRIKSKSKYNKHHHYPTSLSPTPNPNLCLCLCFVCVVNW